MKLLEKNEPTRCTHMVQIQMKNHNNIKGNKSSTFKDIMQCRHCSSGEDETQEKCESTKGMSEKLNIAKERYYVILWRKIKRNIKEFYRKANLNTKDKGQSPTNSNATQGGRSHRIGQEPHGTSIKSQDDSQETGYTIFEGCY